MSKDAKRTRRQFHTEQKVAILRRHLVDKVPVSDLCDEYKLQPSVFYQWQRQLFENMAGALEVPNGVSQRLGQIVSYGDDFVILCRSHRQADGESRR